MKTVVLRPTRKTGKNINCLVCSERFYIPKCHFAKKKFCSRECQNKWYKSHPTNTGRTHFKKGHKPWNTGKKRPELSGELNPNWINGKSLMKTGYIVLNTRNKQLEHRFIMEQFIGRKLDTKEHVHHINKNKTDNRIENLIILSASEHARLHALERSRYA